MPAHPFLLVAMVRDDGAPDGYNTRQRTGKGFSSGRKGGERWEEGKALPARGHAARQHRRAAADLQGGKRLPVALGGLSAGRVCCSALHVRMVKTVVKTSCCLSELKEG